MKNGDKVICVDNSPSHCNCCAGMKCPLVKGGVYVVSATGQTSTGHPFVEVLGMKPNHHHTVFGYDAKRFRLLSEMKSEAARSNAQVA